MSRDVKKQSWVASYEIVEIKKVKWGWMILRCEVKRVTEKYDEERNWILCVLMLYTTYETNKTCNCLDYG